ncbi:hypothetical protein EXIGLDRAFT_196635 [Exidia glandulosa HHB12029]|uniref:Uncharacterized protein n=1 Tax=Exidia glandulosa HHB12029 TaxID=1314781 RepID=A0A166A160_EXIGL|nr:hypothetical protein EXIGLDRAFT_196635 [Exidia glandulosa HHB12029]
MLSNDCSPSVHPSGPFACSLVLSPPPPHLLLGSPKVPSSPRASQIFWLPSNPLCISVSAPPYPSPGLHLQCLCVSSGVSFSSFLSSNFFPIIHPLFVPRHFISLCSIIFFFSFLWDFRFVRFCLATPFFFLKDSPNIYYSAGS